ncbi:MAG: hypothetical protein OZSIB_1391 [Candidatus Ozemobacter sibiricus]|jgi:hypothetical protein|uniref:Uncharacterized protein n=1 Tax=Candidatus Ozemobacter sibiricus TaxID=2268124 RepID=A0A367ZM80_9BACT|nr:MAG: hypothetical protein OZSIB_1391 [Candidatus Ozemobacter sibiricus]
MQLTIRLAEVFLDTPGGVLSIHQISKRLGIPYGTAYNRIHEMGELGCVQIVPQGKAKLCALNPANPMTANLLALGASQTTHRFLTSASPLAPLTAKLRTLIEARLGERLHAALLLNFEAFQGAGQALTVNEHAELASAAATATAAGEPPAPATDEGIEPLALDLFLVMSDESPLDPQLELGIHAIFPPHLHPRVTTMTVSDATLLGMLREKENEAGLAAYHMLRRALLLQGFERFFTLILRAFPPRLL